MTERPNYYAVIPANVRYDEELKANEKLLYGEISALANNSGKCWARNKYFADLYKVTIQTVSGWISHLKEKGYIYIDIEYKENTKEIERRVIRLIGINEKVNTPIKKKVNAPIKENVKDNNTSKMNNTSLNNQYNDEFERIWKMYPKKHGKNGALKAYISARKKGVSAYTVEQGLQRYIDYIKANKIEDRFIKHGSTWFNQNCWNDEYDTTQADVSFSVDKYNEFVDNLDLKYEVKK